MKKCFIKSFVALSVVIFLTSPLFAGKTPSNEVIVSNKEIIPSDKFVFTQIFRNDGTIKGDSFFWCQTMALSGTIDGDLIGACQSANVDGNVFGNIRIAAATINISGKILKNVNAFAAAVNIVDSSDIGGSLLAMGSNINIDGKVKKDVRLYGKNITLNGEFFGDVTVNEHKPERKKEKKKDINSKLTILPGTVIHGTLKYAGDEVDIQKGAKVTNFEWNKPGVSENKILGMGITNYIKTIVRLIFITTLYFLAGFILFKIKPSAFAGLEEIKPWSAASHGLVGLFSIIGAVIIFIILIALSYFISPAFGLVFGGVSAALYSFLILFSIIPAAVFTGKLIAKDKLNIIYRLVLGLIVIKLTLFVLSLLANVPLAGNIFSALEVIVRFVVIIFGTGSLIITTKRFLAKKKNV